MAASGYTPISLYYSTTASAVPTAGNLANGELALNIADMKLYAKNSSGVVTLLASNASTTGVDSLSFGSTGLTPSTATTGAITVAGTLNVANGGTGLTSLTAGYIPYGNGTSALASSSSLFFDGTNLGIGTSSPTQKLQVAGAVRVSDAATEANALQLSSTSTTSTIETRYNYPLLFGTNATERMRLDTAGNLGLGVTPSASSLTTFQCGVYGMVSGTEQANISGNAYYNAGWKYATTGTAVRMSVNEGTGQFRVFTAASGTAGNAISFTQAMTLDASGNLGVGTASPLGRLHIETTSGSAAFFVNSPSATGAGSYISLRKAGAAKFLLGVESTLSGTSDNGTLYVYGANSLTVYTNGSEYFRIGPAGQIGLSGANYGTSGQVLTSGGSGAAPTWTTPASGGSSFSVKTSNYTAVAGDSILANTSGGSFTVTLPASPTTGATVYIQDSANAFLAYPLTVARNGNTIMGLSEDMVAAMNGIGFGLTYNGTTWRIY